MSITLPGKQAIRSSAEGCFTIHRSDPMLMLGKGALKSLLQRRRAASRLIEFPLGARIKQP